MKDRVRVFDRLNRFLRWISEEEETHMLATGLATSVGRGRRRRLTVDADVLSFDGRKRPGNPSSTTYIEKLPGTGPITMLKRYDEHRDEFLPWRDDLTFDELRTRRAA